MQCTIERVTPFAPREYDDQNEPRASNAVAAVTVALGPVKLRLKLWKNDQNQRMWLGMPGHKDKDDQWFSYVQFRDESVKDEIEQRAVALYKSQLSVN